MLLRYIFLLSILLLTSCGRGTPEKDQNPTESGGTLSGTYRSHLDPDEKIALAKKRKLYMSGIRKGDFYSLRNAPEEALANYLSVEEKLPNDQVVAKKIAHVYFLMKEWGKSYDKYITIPFGELTESEQLELLNSLFFDENHLDRMGELLRIPTGTGTREYYGLMDACYTTIHDCIVKMDGYSGSETRIQELKTSIKGAAKISEDLQYRNFTLAVKLYEQGMYRAVEKMTREILKERPDYIEVTKLLGFSLFELGKYEEAKKYLLQYLEKKPKDLESIIRMGEAHFFLGNYVSSNLYLNNAIIAGYTPKTNLERRLAYNYSLLDDSVGMMKVLNYLLQEKDATEDDYAVAISAALSTGDYTRAESWAKSGLEKYPNSNMIRPLSLTAMRNLGDIDNAYALIQNIPEKDIVENPYYLLEKGIILFEMKNFPEAKTIFQSLKSLDGWQEIIAESESYLSRIDAEQSAGTGSSWW